MDLAVAFGDEVTGSIDESVGGRDKEEIAAQNILGLAELLLCLLEIEIDVKGLDEIGDGVGVLVVLLAHNADQILQLLLVDTGVLLGAAAVGDNGGGEVSQNPRAAGLDGVDVGGGEEEVGEDVAGGVVVEEGEQRPVNEPRAVGELSQGVVEQASLN